MNYSDAPPGFQPITEFTDAPPGFKPVDSIPFSPELALKNAPKSAFETAKRVAADILPGQHVQTGFALAQPGGLSNAWEGLKERFGGVENIKRTAEKDPFGLGYDVGGLFTGGKTAIAKKPSTAMPRGVVRSGEELLESGGARMNEAKLNPAKVAPTDIAAPMQKFRDKLRTEAAIDLNTAELKPELKNRIARLEAVNAPPKRDYTAPMTKEKPAAKAPVSLAELHGHSKGLNTFINSTGKTEGRINEQGFVALELKNAVDEMIDAHPESSAFKIGKHEYHRGAMDRSMADIEKDAMSRSMWKSGNEAGAWSAAISAFLKKRSNRYALTPEVRRKLDKLSRDNGGSIAGQFSLNNSFGGNVFARGIELAAGLPPGTGAFIGNQARSTRNARFAKTFNELREEIRAGGPVGK
jgi:hypothetical protein